MTITIPVPNPSVLETLSDMESILLVSKGSNGFFGKIDSQGKLARRLPKELEGLIIRLLVPSDIRIQFKHSFYSYVGVFYKEKIAKKFPFKQKDSLLNKRQLDKSQLNKSQLDESEWKKMIDSAILGVNDLYTKTITSALSDPARQYKIPIPSYALHQAFQARRPLTSPLLSFLGYVGRTLEQTTGTPPDRISVYTLIQALAKKTCDPELQITLEHWYWLHPSGISLMMPVQPNSQSNLAAKVSSLFIWIKITREMAVSIGANTLSVVNDLNADYMATLRLPKTLRCGIAAALIAPILLISYVTLGIFQRSSPRFSTTPFRASLNPKMLLISLAGVFAMNAATLFLCTGYDPALAHETYTVRLKKVLSDLVVKPITAARHNTKIAWQNLRQAHTWPITYML